MAILKHRPTLANWLLVSSFLSCVFFACQEVSHLKDMLGACLGLLMLSVFSLPYLLLLLAELVIVLLVLTLFSSSYSYCFVTTNTNEPSEQPAKN
jgi:hypothetical protein